MDKEIKEQFYATELFNRIEYMCCGILDMLGLEEEQRIRLESFFGNCLDETYEEGIRIGMSDIIESDLDFGEKECNFLRFSQRLEKQGPIICWTMGKKWLVTVVASLILFLENIMETI